ncbi:MAG: lysophospholipid acyltransferase family protein [Bacteroidetes bacterium]|nr:lysophospholipid acyltransferase family protein [Bacteroidota bacterium]
MRQDITAANDYNTPEETPHLLIDRLTFNSRFIFTGLFLKSVFKARRLARNGVYDTRHWVDSSHDIFTDVERCGGRIHITGMDHLRTCRQPVIFLSNHMSTLETMIFPGIIQPLKDVTFVVKEALVNHWAFKDVMRSRNPIVLSRENPREDFRIVMEQGQERLKNKISIIIFPQSTRRVEFRPSEFNSLGTKLAVKAGVQVIPVAIKTDFWGFGKYSSYLGPIDRDNHVHIAFGEPMSVSGSGKEEHLKVIEFIQMHLERWKDK